MKYFKLSLALLILFSNKLISQDYVPMAVDSATWFMASTHENPQFSVYKVLRIEGDTIVNNLSYSKIYHYEYEDYKISLQTRSLLGLIRDDIDTRKVYGGLLGGIQYGFDIFLNEAAQCDWGTLGTFNEHLLYDFSLSVGDTVDVCMLPNPQVISSIEMIERFGYQRKNLLLDDFSSTIMTEGIGTCIGIFKGQECYYTGGGFGYALSNYCIGSFSECNLLTSIAYEIPIDQIKVYPNPVVDILHLDIPLEAKNISLINIQGNTIKTLSNENTIDCSLYPTGLYIVKIETDEGLIYTKKLMKK